MLRPLEKTAYIKFLTSVFSKYTNSSSVFFSSLITACLAFSRYSFSFKFVFRRTVFMELVIFAIGDSRVFSIDYLC